MFLTKFLFMFSICGRTALGSKKCFNIVLILIITFFLVATSYMLPEKIGLGEIFKWEPSNNETQTLEDQKWTVIKDKNGKRHVIFLQNDNFHVLKQTTEIINNDVKFYLYRRDHRDEAKEIEIGDFVALTNFNWIPEKPTKIVVHGYLTDYMSEGIQIIKERLLDSLDVNVILVDWYKQAANYYPYSAGYTKDVGRSVADFIHFLLESESNLKNIHLIGHSLGAHVCGFAGYFTKQKTGLLARITGLDPALPSFENVEITERLDASDAEFVDCIHTCGGFLGIHDPICTADFYPNGGKSVQPGCHWYDFGVCSHSRSHELFAESVIPNHIFPAYTCPNVADQSTVDCRNEGALMGYPAKTNFHGIFYLQTKEEFPYSTALQN